MEGKGISTIEKEIFHPKKKEAEAALKKFGKREGDGGIYQGQYGNLYEL